MSNLPIVFVLKIFIENSTSTYLLGFKAVESVPKAEIKISFSFTKPATKKPFEVVAPIAPENHFLPSSLKDFNL
jgi:hypothetical protein